MPDLGSRDATAPPARSSAIDDLRVGGGILSSAGGAAADSYAAAAAAGGPKRRPTGSLSSRSASRQSAVAGTLTGWRRRTVGTAALRMGHEPPIDGIEHQLGRRRETGLLEDTRAVRAHSLGAQFHPLRGGIDAPARPELQEHLVLAIRQQLVRLAIAVCGEFGCQLLGERRRDVLVA